MRVTLGELADRAADEETRRVFSEYGISASWRVTCRLSLAATANLVTIGA